MTLLILEITIRVLNNRYFFGYRLRNSSSVYCFGFSEISGQIPALTVAATIPANQVTNSYPVHQLQPLPHESWTSFKDLQDPNLMKANELIPSQPLTHMNANTNPHHIPTFLPQALMPITSLRFETFTCLKLM